MNNINRIRGSKIGFGRLFGEKTQEKQKRRRVQRLLFQRGPDEEWSFDEGKICLNGEDIEVLMQEEGDDVSFLIALGGGIDDYRQDVWFRYGSDRRDFNGKTQGLLDQILHRLNTSYEAMTGGLKISLQGGRLWLNDIDPRVVLGLFLSNPNEERRGYLKSIQTKLALILQGKAGKSMGHGVMEEAKRLFVQIDKALENSKAASSPPLLAAVNHLGR